VKWISVWCRAFDINFGEVTFPDRLDYPRPQKVSALDGIHEVKSGRIVVVDAQVIPEYEITGLRSFIFLFTFRLFLFQALVMMVQHQMLTFGLV